MFWLVCSLPGRRLLAPSDLQVPTATQGKPGKRTVRQLSPTFHPIHQIPSIQTWRRWLLGKYKQTATAVIVVVYL